MSSPSELPERPIARVAGEPTPATPSSALADDAERERAYSLAHRALGSRERTVVELRGMLERRDIACATIEAVVADLLEGGLLDDARYARIFTEDRRRLDRWGAERIARDLDRRGVDADLVAAALEGQPAEAELAAAVSLVADRFASLLDDRERDRAWRMLVRRGYAPALAYEAVRARERDGDGSSRA